MGRKKIEDKKRPITLWIVESEIKQHGGKDAIVDRLYKMIAAINKRMKTK